MRQERPHAANVQTWLDDSWRHGEMIQPADYPRRPGGRARWWDRLPRRLHRWLGAEYLNRRLAGRI
jgi:hypothetical protein